MKQYKKRREFLKKALYKAPTIVLLGQIFDASTLQAASRGGGSRGGGSTTGGLFGI
jgi:Tfp pilus assembly pilus retraction ATPase PilT